MPDRPNPPLHSSPASIAFHSLSTSGYLGFLQRLGAGGAGWLPSFGFTQSQWAFQRMLMKFIALEIEMPTATSQDFEPHLKNEARRLWELQQQGHIREAYFRADQHTAVLVLECQNLPEAQKLTSSFPLVQHGLIRFDIIPLLPYSGLSRLFE